MGRPYRHTAAKWTAQLSVFTAKQESSPRNGRKVALFQNQAMMQLVAGHDKGQRPHRYFFSVGGAAPLPSLFLQRFEKCDGSHAHRPKLLGQLHKRTPGEVSSAHIIILLKSGKRRLVSTRDPQSAVNEDSLAVDHVAQRLFHRPFVRRITKIAVTLAMRRKKLRHLQSLSFQNAQNVAAFHFGNIGFVIGCVFARFGPGRCGSSRFHRFSIPPLPTVISTSSPQIRPQSGLAKGWEPAPGPAETQSVPAPHDGTLAGGRSSKMAPECRPCLAPPPSHSPAFFLLRSLPRRCSPHAKASGPACAGWSCRS